MDIHYRISILRIRKNDKLTGEFTYAEKESGRIECKEKYGR